MRLAKFLTAVAVASLATAPALSAPTDPAAKLSVAQAKSARAATPARKSNKLTSGIIIAVLAVAAITAGVIIATDGDDEPDSP